MTLGVRESPRPYVWDVAALLQAAGDALSTRFGACVVRGEISGFTQATSGHCYFALKDADRGGGTVRCAMFRRASSLLDFAPSDGQIVDVRGRLGVYGPRGELQLVVESMQRGGAGALYERFLLLRARLEREGLFDPATKRSVRKSPAAIGIVTSPAAAALHDVLTALARRAPHVQAVVYPSPVQGADAAVALAAAIGLANQRAEVDTLILCRGGGSLEDLWTFNDERVVRAVCRSGIPVICGVGHETDVTLADLAADLRAPTPTAAAELAAFSQQASLDALATCAAAMRRRMTDAVDVHGQRLDHAALRLARPGDALMRHQRRLALLEHRLIASGHRRFERARSASSQFAQRLHRAVSVCLVAHEARMAARKDRLNALDPLRVLGRGYALLTDANGHAIVSAEEVAVGMSLHASVAEGAFDVAVTGGRNS